MCKFGKTLVFLSYLKDNLAAQSVHDEYLLCFNTVNTLFHYLLASGVYAEQCDESLMVLPLLVFLYLAAYTNFSLSLPLHSFTLMCCGMGHFGSSK